MRTPFFSIIIPALNEEKFLPRLLNDIRRQQYKDYEVIVVDAKSVDHTVENVESFAQKIERLRILTSTKKNICFQRNMGAAHASGRYLIFFDADIQIYAGYLSSVHDAIISHHAKFLTTYQLSDGRNNLDLMIIETANYILNLLVLIEKQMAPAYNFIVRKDVFDAVGGFDEDAKFSEDHELSIRIGNSGVRLYVIKRHLLKWSFRRLRKDGRLPIIFKYTMAALYTLLFGKITHTFFNYPMGGLYFASTSANSTQDIDRYLVNLRKYLKRLVKSSETLVNKTGDDLDEKLSSAFKPLKKYIEPKKVKSFFNKYLSKLSSSHLKP